MSNIATAPAKKDDVRSILMKMEGQIKRALPHHMSAERFTRIALTELQTTPLLAKCNVASFLGSLMTAAQLGCEIGKALGHCYLIPFNNHKKGIIECQFILGYKGMIDLARRSGQVISLSAHEVYANDEFDYEYGLNEKLYHKPSLGERGELLCFYAVARLVGGGHQFEVMSLADVKKVRDSSKAKSFGPWVDHFTEMAKKTAIRKLFKYLPVSVEMEKAITLDEAAESGVQADYVDNIFDGEVTYTIDENGEIMEPSPVGQEALKTAADKLAEKI